MKKLNLKLIALGVFGCVSFFLNEPSMAQQNSNAMAALDSLQKLDPNELKQLQLRHDRLEQISSKALGFPVELYARGMSTVTWIIWHGDFTASGFDKALPDRNLKESFRYRRGDHRLSDTASDHWLFKCVIQQLGALRNLNSENIKKIKELGLPLRIVTPNSGTQYFFRDANDAYNPYDGLAIGLNQPENTAFAPYYYYEKRVLKEDKLIQVPVSYAPYSDSNPNRNALSKEVKLEISMSTNYKTGECKILTENINGEFQRVLPLVEDEKRKDDEEKAREELAQKIKKEEADRRQAESLKRLSEVRALIDADTSSAEKANSAK